MLTELLGATRARTLALAAPLTDEDAQLQSMPDASPAKWHLAHTTWFFETLVLAPHLPGYRVFDARWPQLFNSYYESLGPRHARPQRGLLSRPSLAEVKAYRAHVDAALADLLPSAPPPALSRVELGCHHEQQHQELLLTDILHAFSCNPLLPAYQPTRPTTVAAPEQAWLRHVGGIVEVGHAGPGFAFDNEGPRHAVLLTPFEVSNRLVTCGEYADFIASGGYREPLLWLSDGWATVQAQGWQRPLYWQPDGSVFGLHGVQPLDPNAPVMQLSFYEACAFAEWAGARLPTEFEWEAAASLQGFEQASDQAWQWTRSGYAPYPGYRPAAGAVGEYNGKFMVGQQVLRGGSLATPPGHSRPSYRNFFPPAARWQFSGLRLAR
ncbi:MAG: ergothioneine biosynthesis protein EgtB [Burkholderiales bacterium]|nr:MAG: ergothioneine biosynthesis protein EgtB [Burkholderiales bacterium]